MSVYFITAREVGRVKVGCAFNPHDRFERLQTASPVELALEAVMRGAHKEERELHLRFAADRLHGEWFNITPEIELMILTYRAPKRLKRADLVSLLPEKPPRDPEDHWELKMLKKKLASGDIHFPFRALAEVETS